ncbi:MAG: long-chain fatty acid--CoA ligase [Planctomycetota bacterium]
MIESTMMSFPLTLTAILERAGTYFKNTEIVWRHSNKTLVRSRYGDFYHRSRALAQSLINAGLRPGDRVATLCWNHMVHLEAYFGIPAAGGVVHPLNLRLHPEELTFIINHAQDRFLIIDDVVLSVLNTFRKNVNFERIFVVSSEKNAAPEFESYEDFIAGANGELIYPQIEEGDAAAMCYTSGTTGKPKGIVYSHRSIVLHAFAAALPDSFAISQHDTMMFISPMFHVNGWGLPHAAVMAGSKLVFPGVVCDPASLLELLSLEKVTMTGAVPTLWIAMREVLDKNPGRYSFAPNCRAIVGGSAPAGSLIRDFDRHGIRLIQGWGMTETSPVATLANLKANFSGADLDTKIQYRAKQGVAVPFVEIRIVNDAGLVMPWDGRSIGEIQIRGPWVARSYYNSPDSAHRWSADGWFLTGDVGTLDPAGYLKITDRTKDLIKSGGEWISSVDLENTLMSHRAVKEAAVVGIAHEKWGERPAALIVVKDGCAVTEEELSKHLSLHFAKWQIPDAYLFVDSIAKTSIGKFKKTAIREQLKDWKWK